MRLNALAVTAGFAVMVASAYPAVNGEAVIIAPEAHGFLHARQGVEIYGLTAGFSLNKDHHQMPFVDKDRIFSGDLEEGINILKHCPQEGRAFERQRAHPLRHMNVMKLSLS